MKLFDKLKNIFIEEELIDNDEPISETVNIKEEKIEVKEENVVKNTDLKTNTDSISDRSLLDTKENFKFPIIFEDDDFKEEKKKTKSINVLERENTKYETEIKKEIKPQKKTFKPSLVISPVYGVLDKNYSKDDISLKDGLLSDNLNMIDIDSVIKKAYGNNEENKEIKLEEGVNIEESDSEIDLFKEEEKQYKISEVDEKIKSIDELLKDTNDDDFYSLVDSMYKDEEGDSEE